MEHIIAQLLQDFEHGRLTRRQLIQTLTLGVTAASAVAAAPVVAAEGQTFKAVAVNHISYQVADYTKTREFYTSLLGMKATQDNGSQCYLTFGDQGSWLLARNARAGSPTPKVDHIAYTIETWNKDNVKAELERRGLNPRVDTENSFHVKDPDGFDLQISGKEMKP